MTGIILAGGESRRMGKDKALLEIDGRRIIEMVAERLRSIFDDVMVVSSHSPVYQFLGLKVVRDVVCEKGPLGGIYTGLLVSESEYNFICACDMPFLNLELLRFMLSQVNDDTEVIVPIVKGLVEPLHSIYSKRCLGAIRAHLEDDELRVRDFLSEVKCNYLSEDLIRRYDPDLLSFFNLNTPEDLEVAKRYLCST